MLQGDSGETELWSLLAEVVGEEEEEEEDQQHQGEDLDLGEILEEVEEEDHQHQGASQDLGEILEEVEEEEEDQDLDPGEILLEEEMVEEGEEEGKLLRKIHRLEQDGEMHLRNEGEEVRVPSAADRELLSREDEVGVRVEMAEEEVVVRVWRQAHGRN